MTAVLPLEPTFGRCRRCGKLSSLTAAFCPRCGIRLREVSDGLQAEVLDDEPVTGNWEILDSASPRGPWPVMSMPTIPPIPVIPKAPSLPFAPIVPNWSASRYGGRRKRIWLPILIGFFVVRGLAAVGTHTANVRSSAYSPTPPLHTTQVNVSHPRH